MTLVEGEIPKGPGTQTGTTGTRETPNTVKTLRTIDQPEALETEETPTENDKRYLLKTSDQRSKALGGSPETKGYSAGSEAKTDPEWLGTYATCLTIVEKEVETTSLLPLSDQKLFQIWYRHSWILSRRSLRN